MAGWWTARAFACALGVGIVVAGCKSKEPPPPPANPPPPPVNVPPATGGPLPLSPLDRREAIAARYRLGPDRRFLRALADVERLVTGKPPAAEPKATFKGGKWTVDVGGTTVATFSEFPTFAEALAACVARARALATPEWTLAGKPSADATLPFDDAAFDLAAAAQASWAKEKSRAALHDAARALVAIAFEAHDTMGLADALPARAIAVLALDKAFGTEEVPALESTLAAGLLYRRDAQATATKLPPNDPTRLFVMRADKELAAAADRPNAPMWTRYLWLRRLVGGHHDRDATRAFVGARLPDALSVPILAIRTGHTDLSSWNESAAILPAAVLLATGRAAGAEDAIEASKALHPKPAEELFPAATAIRTALRVPRGKTFERFDRDLAKVDAQGPFLDGDVRRAYLRGHLYAAVDLDGRLELEMYSSLPRAKEFLGQLSPSTSQESKDFRQYFQVLIELNEGAAKPRVAAQLVAAPWTFGSAVRERVWSGVERLTDAYDPALAIATQKLAAVLDTRPEAIEAMAGAASDGISDVVLMETLHKAAIDLAPRVYPDRELWWATRTGDEAALQVLADDETIPATTRIHAIDALERQKKLDPAKADAAVDRVLASAGDNWSPRESATRAAIDRGRLDRGRKLAGEWIKRHPNGPGLSTVAARGEVARSFELEQKWQEALDVVEPALASGAGTPMCTASRLHERLGHHDRAVDLAQKVVKRYPDAKALGCLAFVRWMAREHGAAADDIAKSGVRLVGGGWRTLGESFAKAFAGAPADGAKAMEALQKAGYTKDQLTELYFDAYERKDYALAWEVTSRLKNPDEPFAALAANYGVLKVWKGEPAAQQWLRPQIRPEESEHFAERAFDLGEEEAVFSVAEVGKPDELDNLWLMRAASAQRNKPFRGRLADVRRHYETAGNGGGTYWHSIGRYVAGLSDDAAAAAIANDPRKTCEVSYYMGVRAHGEGRFADAVAFYRSAAETYMSPVGEYRWAISTLLRWRSLDVPLTRLGEVDHPVLGIRD